MGATSRESSSASPFREYIRTLSLTSRRLPGETTNAHTHPWPNSGEVEEAAGGKGTAHADRRASANMCLITAIRES